MIQSKRYLCLWAALVILAACPFLGAASKVALLLSDRNKIYAIINDGIKQAVQGDVSEIFLQDGEEKSYEAVRQFKPDIVIAIGNSAALWARDKILKTPVVVSGVMLQFESLLLDGSLQNYLRAAAIACKQEVEKKY